MAGMTSGLFGLVVGDELGEFLFQQFVLGLEARDEAEDLLQDLAQGQAAVHGGGFAQLVEGVVLLGLVEDLAVHVVDDPVPLAGFDSVGPMNSFSRTTFLEFLEEHAVDLHPLGADWLFLDRREDVRAEMLVGCHPQPPGRCQPPDPPRRPCSAAAAVFSTSS